jgi:type II secretory pathway component PulK
MQDRESIATLIALSLTLFAVAAVSLITRPDRREVTQGTIPIVYRIDPNHADADTLCLLPRIGPGIAQRIADDRRTNGPFTDADDLARVPMVGDKTVAALRPWLTFTPVQEKP